ncbi:hypothetical protein [Croceibacterium xixiisoli]|uniref:hypothetical protein n=1 Tax=Croceibacterium xixiisoli TaxID=1476466 RepID=UPI00136E3A01|nr:hypothetical protein [Croceibacterium xixiisoli]
MLAAAGLAAGALASTPAQAQKAGKASKDPPVLTVEVPAPARADLPHPPMPVPPRERSEVVVAPPPASGGLTGRAAVERVVGNTLIGAPDGKTDPEDTVIFHFAEGGRAAARAQSGADKPRRGNWQIGENGQLCANLAGDKDPTLQCLDLVVNGDHADLLEDGERLITLKILPGNPYKL